MLSAKNAVYFYEIKSFTDIPVLQDYSAEAKEFLVNTQHTHLTQHINL